MKKIFLGAAAAALFFSACTQNSSSGTSTLVDSTAVKAEANKKVIMAALEAMNKHDVDGVFKDCAADFKEQYNGFMPTQTNIDSIKASLKGYLTAMPDFKCENPSVVASGDTVIVLGDWSGTFKNEFMGMKPTNKSFKMADADVFIFNKDGKIISHKSVQGDPTLFAQIGVPIAPKN